MQGNLTPKKGYVYILTNPSFREDWIKIGKSTRPVDIRSKELDNTAVPLPFEIYATMKTASYDKVESMLHVILEGAHARIRKNREFFNVKPEVALNAFYKIAELLPDAIVYLKGEEPIDNTPSVPKTTIKTTNPANLEEICQDTELPKHAKYTIDGEHLYSMAKFAYVLMRQLISDNPSLSFNQLETMFPRDILMSWKYCGVVVRKEVLETSSLSLAVRKKAYRYEEDESLLCTPSDGVYFYTSTQWMRDSFKTLVAIANSKGYNVYFKGR
jgi:hypothetical protein